MNDMSSFAFTISLAAVINGLGIVRLMVTLSDYLRARHEVQVNHYWVYLLLLALQFLLHVLLWWVLFGTRAAGTLNFVSYLYLLIGPIFLYLATSVLLPNVDNDAIDLRAQYFRLAPTHYTVVAVVWFWAIFLWPVLVGAFAPGAPWVSTFLVLTLVLRFTASAKVHSVVVPLYFGLIVLFIAVFQIRLGEVAKRIVESL